MNTKNNHIEEYLDYYCSLDYAPEFAVMLKGGSGSGKTWFIQQYIEALKSKGQNALYCSLYGIARFDEIEDDLFGQMHPLISENGLQLTGKIIQHALKASIDVHLKDGTLPEYLENSDRHILFFDDVERCKLPIDELLGYINGLVEHKGLKVVIALNEEDLQEQEAYTKVKEKLIGQTFEITSDVTGALERFIALTRAPGLNKILEINQDAIISIYHKAGYNNLRHLKQSIMDFERFYLLLSDKARQLPQLLKLLLKEHLAFCLEIKKGAIAIDDVRHISQEHASFNLSGFEEKTYKTHTEIFIDKYPEVDISSPIIGLQNMADFFDTGVIDKEMLASSIDNSRFFMHENQKEWLKLWHYFNLTDEEFHKIFANVQRNYSEKKYTKSDELLHVYGLFLELSFNNLYDIDAASIVQEAKEYIKQLKEENRLAVGEQQNAKSDFSHLHYHASDTPEFKEIQSYLERAIKAATVEQMPQITHNLLILMRTDSSKFWDMIAEPNKEGYHDQVIFPYIDPQSFVKHFVKVPDMRKITAAIAQRYKSEFTNATLRKELDWLKKVRELLMLESHRKQGALSGYVLLNCIKEGFDVAISRLERADVDDYLARC